MKKHISEKGQSLVEFAISLVVILLLLAGAVELGIALFQYIQLRDAAQEGALYGSICPVETKIKTRVRNASSSPVDLSIASGIDAVTVVVEGRTGTTTTSKAITAVTPGDGVFVSVSYNHRVFMPFASVFAGPTIPISASVTDTVLDTDTTKAECQ
jgi:Flp pilus assembly protein TadG